MTKLSYPEAPLAYTEPLEKFPPRSFPRVLMSTKQYYRWLKANPFYRGYRGYGWVAGGDNFRRGRTRFRIVMQ